MIRLILLFVLPFPILECLAANSVELTAKRYDGSTIRYYLFEQDKRNQSDILLLVLQGSDCNSVLEIKPIFNSYKNIWPEADLLLIEKYGIDKDLTYNTSPERDDCPRDYLEKDNPEQRLNDINTVLDTINKERTYKKYIVIGGSEGAVIANLLAADNHYIDASVSFNGGGRWFIDDVLHSITMENKGIEEARESREGFKRFSQHILTSKPFELKMSGHGYRWWHQMLSIDQLSVLRTVNIPLLIVQGGADSSVSSKKVNEMMLSLGSLGKNNIKYLFYKDLNHRFNTLNGKSQVDNVVSDINSWLKIVLKKPKSRLPAAKTSTD